jgi:hypothetical protein
MVDDLSTRESLLGAVRELREDLDRVVVEAGAERMGESGSLGEWTLKDVIAHLTGWRKVTAARLEAGLHGVEPQFPWPPHLDEERDLDEINRWFFETSREKPVGDVLSESRETFERVERAISAMSEDDLLTPGRFAWLHWTGEALGPAVVRGTLGHYYGEHEPQIRDWLARE